MTKDRSDLDALVERSRAAVAAMSPAERDAMHAEQAESWARGEMAMRCPVSREDQTAMCAVLGCRPGRCTVMGQP